VYGVSYSPDGRRIASGSWDTTVRLWDAETGKEIQKLQGHSGMVWGVAFSPDGRRLASASWDQTVKLWDVETGEEVFTFGGHMGQVSSVAFSRDGRWLGSGSDDGFVRVWDARPWTPELRVDHAAQSLVRFHRAKALRKEQLIETIGADATISAEVRDRALELVRTLRDSQTTSQEFIIRGDRWVALKEIEKAIADYTDAIRLNPRSAVALNGRAWIRATTAMEQHRDGEQAIADATRACELTDWKDAAMLDTLAAAYAESGNFEKAVHWQTRAVEMAEDALKVELVKHLDQYKDGKPHRE
jgi:hypothetical protein